MLTPALVDGDTTVGERHSLPSSGQTSGNQSHSHVCPPSRFRRLNHGGLGLYSHIAAVASIQSSIRERPPLRNPHAESRMCWGVRGKCFVKAKE